MAEVKKGGFGKTLKIMYLYLVSLICVIVFVIGAVILINTALKAWVFPVDNVYYYGPMSVDNCSAQILKDSKLFETPDNCMKYYEEQQVKEATNQRNMDLAQGVAMTVVSLPIWLFHMYLAKKEKKQGEV